MLPRVASLCSIGFPQTLIHSQATQTVHVQAPALHSVRDAGGLWNGTGRDHLPELRAEPGALSSEQTLEKIAS